MHFRINTILISAAICGNASALSTMKMKMSDAVDRRSFLGKSAAVAFASSMVGVPSQPAQAIGPVKVPIEG